MRREIFYKRGQSLIELILAIALGVVFIGVAALVVAPLLKINTETNEAKLAGAMARELMENAKTWTENDWHGVYGLLPSPPPGISDSFFLSTSTVGFSSSTGVESIIVGTTTYNRFFYLQHVCRVPSNDINVAAPIGLCEGLNTVDPSLIKINVGYSWSPEYATKTFSMLVSRYRNLVTSQTDWSEGPGVGGAVTITSGFASSSAIDSTSTPGVIKIQGL